MSYQRNHPPAKPGALIAGPGIEPGHRPYESRFRASGPAMACQGIEPGLAVSKTAVRIHHTRMPINRIRQPITSSKCPCQELNLVHNLRRVVCNPVHFKDKFSSAGGIRTRNHLFLKQVAQASWRTAPQMQLKPDRFLASAETRRLELQRGPLKQPFSGRRPHPSGCLPVSRVTGRN